MEHPSHRSDATRTLLDEMERHLDAIEAEMRRIGYWSSSPPDLLGKVSSYLEAPTFELWLQQVFLPRAREAVSTGDLPHESSVGTMALRQYDYHSSIPEAHPLMDLLFAFDAMVEDYARAKAAT